MIRLHKGPTPSILVANAYAWTAAFALNKAQRHYAHRDIRDKLRIESYGKCAYCESRMEHVSYSHIEHVLPKSAFPALVCDWDNLVLACTVCNTNKGNYYDRDCLLLNPYVDNPSEHLKWLGPMVCYRTEDRGRITIGVLDLNRGELVYQRTQRLQRAQDIVALMKKSSPIVAKALQIDLDALVNSRAEYSAAAQAFIEREMSEI